MVDSVEIETSIKCCPPAVPLCGRGVVDSVEIETMNDLPLSDLLQRGRGVVDSVEIETASKRKSNGSRVVWKRCGGLCRD